LTAPLLGVEALAKAQAPAGGELNSVRRNASEKPAPPVPCEQSHAEQRARRGVGDAEDITVANDPGEPAGRDLRPDRLCPGSQLAVAVNGTVDASTPITALGVPGNLSGTALLPLAAGDVLTLRNNSAVPMTLALSPSVGARISIEKLN
jgi:hypothetical protein